MREIGKQMIQTILKKPINVDILEKYVYGANQYSEQDYLAAIYECVGFFIGRLETQTHLQSRDVQECIELHVLRRSGHDDPLFDPIRQKMDEIDQFAIRPFEIEEGVIECKCGSKRTISYQRQTRAADEGATTFSQCVECGTKWRHNN
jgi:DNA-directed RNA polymerase subunit M/transcription elongation factor TFIIS